MELKTFTAYYLIHYGATAQIVECKARQYNAEEYILEEDSPYLGRQGTIYLESEVLNKNKLVVLNHGLRKIRMSINSTMNNLGLLTVALQEFEAKIKEAEHAI